MSSRTHKAPLGLCNAGPAGPAIQGRLVVLQRLENTRQLKNYRVERGVRASSQAHKVLKGRSSIMFLYRKVTVASVIRAFQRFLHMIDGCR